MSILAAIKKDAEAVKAFIVKVAAGAPHVFATIAADEAAIAPVVEAFVPGSTTVINLANNLLALAEQAVVAAGTAAGQNALNITLDVASVNAVKTLISSVKKV